MMIDRLTQAGSYVLKSLPLTVNREKALTDKKFKD